MNDSPNDRTPYDTGYKLLFSNPKLVQDLLEGFIKPEWLDELDLESLQPFKASFTTDDLRERHDDSIWRVRLRSEWLYLYLLIEFQSSDDYYMACRVMTYVGLLYQDIIRHERLSKGQALPPVLPIVLYSGTERWTGPVDMSELVHRVHPALSRYIPSLSYCLVQEKEVPDSYHRNYPDNVLGHLIGLGFSRDTADLRRRLGHLRGLLTRPDYRYLQRSVAIWLNRLLRVRFKDEALPELHDLNEVDAMLAERLADWTEQWKREGLEKGRLEGLEKGRLEGREEGREEGRRQEAIIMLTRFLTRRFGPLDELIQERLQRADVEQIEAWSDRVLDAGSVEEVFQ